MWELAMDRFQLKQEQKIKRIAEELPCTYIVFDVLYAILKVNTGTEEMPFTWPAYFNITWITKICLNPI
ncbi:hypothetical protein [Bacillus methanolicus]|uniref:Uncharacterized protein n=1 Tax=Bacillus methanolicus (strain MGA3 / ATCC 53907) TaxID=796606 RepID=I3E3B7_BACMM|nr:hypothetical protein [Bacillus methanolicus]AIE58929.1 hypothetical protein BMMGA3_02295 [Bacillus methanolicus MGA3]EIJ80988.1 hypothetical protein MGA3_11885 [Bacillus methanolicus MGA3]